MENKAPFNYGRFAESVKAGRPFKLVTSHSEPEEVFFLAFMRNGKLVCEHNGFAEEWNPSGKFDIYDSVMDLQMIVGESEDYMRGAEDSLRWIYNHIIDDIAKLRDTEDLIQEFKASKEK